MRERGNILFIILLVVVLFAALTYAVTNSTRGGSKSVSAERATALAAQMVQSATLVENSLRRLQLSTGLDIDKIDLYAANQTRNGDVDGCTQASCNLFDPAGGNVPVPLTPKDALDTTTTCPTFNGMGMPYFMVVSVANIGATSKPELALVYCGVKLEVCRAINVSLGLIQPGDADINSPYGTSTSPNDFSAFSGPTNPYTSTTTANKIGSVDARTKGVRTFCSLQNPASTVGNFLFHVLWEQ